MTQWLRVARAIAGLLTISTLLAMVLGQFIHPELTMKQPTIWILVTLAGGLLGADKLVEKGPLEISLGGGTNDDNN